MRPGTACQISPELDVRTLGGGCTGQDGTVSGTAVPQATSCNGLHRVTLKQRRLVATAVHPGQGNWQLTCECLRP